MKALIIQVLAGVALATLVSYIKEPKDRASAGAGTEECIKIHGLAIEDGNTEIDSVEVTLYEKNEAMEWVSVTSVPHHDHHFIFTLKRNTYYTIEVQKPGYVKRSVVVSTYLPEEMLVQHTFEYWFQLECFKQKEGLDVNLPIQLIGYNVNSGVFENTHRYVE